MSALQDFVDQINETTSAMGDDVKAIATQLKAAVDNGDPAALANLGKAVTTLEGVGDQLHAMASGGEGDTLPTPPADDGHDNAEEAETPPVS